MSWRHTITARLISGGQRYLRRSVLDYASAVSDIKVNKEGAFGWVIFDRPERRNAMTEAMWTALPEILSTLADDPQIRVIILRGAGQDVFVSGADVSELQRARLDDSGESLETPAKSYQTHIEAALEAIATVPRPVVAMIHGWTIGAGAAIALHADLRYADDDAVFAIPAARLGLSFGIDNTKALIDVVGSAAAKRSYSPDDATRPRKRDTSASTTASIPKRSLKPRSDASPRSSPTMRPSRFKAQRRSFGSGRRRHPTTKRCRRP